MKVAMKSLGVTIALPTTIGSLLASPRSAKRRSNSFTEGG